MRAYLRAAELIRSAPTSVAHLVRSGRVRDMRGVGPGIEAKLRELVETGEIAKLRDLESELDPALIGLGACSASPRSGQFMSRAISI